MGKDLDSVDLGTKTVDEKVICVYGKVLLRPTFGMSCSC